MSDFPNAAGDSAPVDHSVRNRQVISILIVATFVVILNETIMSVALPRMMVAFGATASAVQWLTTAFLLTMATVIPVTGFLIQRVNTRPLFILAMSLFSLGTFLAAISPTLGLLIGARVVQALGTAIMMPLLMTTVMTLVPEHRRGPVMGNISLVISVAPAIGPAVSGIVLNYLSWPWLYWLVLPISLAVLVLGARWISNVTEPRYAPLDYLSVPLAALGFGGLVYGLSSFGEGAASEAAGGGGANLGLISFGVGVVALGVFILRQLSLQKRDAALLDLRTFRNRNFTVSVTLMGLAMAMLLGTIILLPIFMQDVLGLSTMTAGLLLLPGGILMGLMGPQVGKLYESFGPRPLLVPGLTLVSLVLWSMTLMTPETSQWAILAGHMVISIGLGLTFTPLFTTSLSSVPPQLYSHGSAMLGSIQQVAGAAGVALLVAVMSAGFARSQAGGAEQVVALSNGLTQAFMVGACLSVAGLVVAFFVRRPPSFEAGPVGS